MAFEDSSADPPPLRNGHSRSCGEWDSGQTQHDLVDQLASAHLRHDQISNDEVDRRLGFFDQVQGFLSAIGRQDLISEGAQHGFAHGEKQVLVIDEEDGLAGLIIGWRRQGLDDDLGGGRQVDPDEVPWRGMLETATPPRCVVTIPYTQARPRPGDPTWC